MKASAMLALVFIALYFSAIIAGPAPRVLSSQILDIEIPFVTRAYMIIRTKLVGNEFMSDFYYNVSLRDVRELSSDGESLQNHKVMSLDQGRWSTVKTSVHPKYRERTVQEIEYSYTHTITEGNATINVPLLWKFQLSDEDLERVPSEPSSREASYEPEADNGQETAMQKYLKSVGDLEKHHLGVEFLFGDWPFASSENVLSFRFRVATYAGETRLSKDSLVWKSIIEMGHLDGVEIANAYSLLFYFTKFALLDDARQSYVGIGVSDVFDALDIYVNFAAYEKSLYYISSINVADASVWGTWGIILLLVILAAGALFAVGYVVRIWWRRRYEEIHAPGARRLFD